MVKGKFLAECTSCERIDFVERIYLYTGHGKRVERERDG